MHHLLRHMHAVGNGFGKHDWTPIISQRLGVDELQTRGSICQDVCVCVCFAVPCSSGRIITHFK